MKYSIYSLMGGIFSSCLVLVGYWYFFDNNHPIADYYEIENAVLVSPHSVRKSIDQGIMNMTLVDLRSAEEFNEAHIRGAINIPAYRDKDHSAYDQTERIIGSFEALPKGKEIVVYCYSRACMTGRKVGKILADQGIFVKHLGIGWNEWRYDWKSWNHEHEWNTTHVYDYIEGSGVLHAGSNSLPAILPCTSDSLTGC